MRHLPKTNVIQILKWTLLILAGFICSCSDDESNHLTAFEKDLVADLEAAYKSNDTNMLQGFLEEWKVNIAPNDEKDINDDVTQTIYDIYDAFYFPDDPDYLGEIEQQVIPETPPAYLVIQNRLTYQLQPDDLLGETTNDIKIDTIVNFKPKLDHLGQERVLYLTNAYHNAIRQFLGAQYKTAGTNEIVSAFLPKEESIRRGEFLNIYLHMINKWNAGNWTLQTPPEIEIVYINEELTRAMAIYYYAYQDGETILEKIDGKWVITESREVGIE